MKGLLYMDFTLLRRRYWYVLLMAALFGAMSFSDRNVTLFTLYPYLLLALLPANLVNMESGSRWYTISDALPLTKRALVGEKYLLGLLLLLLAAALSLLFGYAGAAIAERSMNLPEKLALVPVGIALGMLMIAIQHLATYALGPWWGALTVILNVLLFIVLALHVPNIPQVGLPLLLISSILYAASWLASAAFVTRRER